MFRLFCIFFITLVDVCCNKDVYVNGKYYSTSPSYTINESGIISCTPTHVKNNQCSDVDDNYYKALAISQFDLGI